jgi:hypothetical protein
MGTQPTKPTSKGPAQWFFMAHISITQGPATWAERVSDDEHGRRA